MRIDEGKIRGRLSERVIGPTEETLNAILKSVADALVHAQGDECTPKTFADTRTDVFNCSERFHKPEMQVNH